AAKAWIWNLLSVISATRLAKYSQPPYRVSSAFGQLAVYRHFISGFDCAIAGAATAVAARPTPPTFKKSRRFICFPSMFLPIPTKGQRSGVVFSGLPMAGAGLMFRNVGPET